MLAFYDRATGFFHQHGPSPRFSFRPNLRPKDGPTSESHVSLLRTRVYSMTQEGAAYLEYRKEIQRVRIYRQTIVHSYVFFFYIMRMIRCHR